MVREWHSLHFFIQNNAQGTRFENSEWPAQSRMFRFSLIRRLPTCILVGMLVPRKNRERGATRLRDPERTRERLLQAAFREIYRSGFQSASLDTILVAAGVTKGALYHHFKSKEGLGYAVVEEVIAPDLRAKWLHPLQRAKDPIDALVGIVKSESVRAEDVRGGCPLNNLAQEMSPLHEGFRKRLAMVFHAWRWGIAAALREGQVHGRVRSDVEAAEIAGFLIATLEGYVSLAKNAQDANVLKAGKKNMVNWLRSLRPPGNHKRG
jgi:TetR/AcrR family transcriptional regulator, transcriptional repressor for nem operon